MKASNSILSSFGTTIFTTMSAMALEHKAINLGQGFPDTDGPEDIRQVAAKSALEGPNQYPPMMGIPELRQATAKHNNYFYDLDVDWETETIITSGATEALASSIFGLIEPGDEAILLEPLYDSYLPILERAGGIPKLVRVEPPDWKLKFEKLEQSFSDNTKLVILNNPMNPSGKVFSHDELEFLASLIKKYDAYAVCDEVYEHLIYDGITHTPLMSFPGMRERCIRISSAGKTFSMTGWKVGYSVASPKVLDAVAKAHQFLTFTTPPNLQLATAYGLNKGEEYFKELSREMELRRNLVVQGLRSLGFKTTKSQGTYFLTVDYSALNSNLDDLEFCKYLTKEVGVAAVPFSAFYKDGGGKNHIRFCYCKKEHLLVEAMDRLTNHFGKP